MRAASLRDPQKSYFWLADKNISGCFVVVVVVDVAIINIFVVSKVFSGRTCTDVDPVVSVCVCAFYKGWRHYFIS